MTDLDHIERVRKLAEQARVWEDQPDPYSDENMALIRSQLETPPPTPKVCTCQTCGVVNARVRAALTARGWDASAVHHVHIDGFDFRGGCDPYLAVAKVESEEVRRAYEDLTELLTDEVLDEIEAALRRHSC